MDVTIYTDPSCPFGFTAHRQELQLAWHYGEHLTVTRRMIVLVEHSGPYADAATTERIAANRKRLGSLYGMPLRPEAPIRRASTLDASRAFVGARRHQPDRADLLLRALQRRALSAGEPLDEISTIHAAGLEAGIASDAIDRWLKDEDVEAELREDMAAARAPLPEARALSHRLSRADGQLRYSTASAMFEHDGRRIVVPGFQPFEAYEVAVANLAPKLPRRPAPRTVEEILSWVPYALATGEIAALREIDLEPARLELEAAGAQPDRDGYWRAPA
jgi:predicted DsbA family dithiol-disulfide isomerase